MLVVPATLALEAEAGSFTLQCVTQVKFICIAHKTVQLTDVLSVSIKLAQMYNNVRFNQY